MGRREHKGGGHAEGDGLRRDRGDRARQGLPHQAPPREGSKDREVPEVPQEDGARDEVGPRRALEDYRRELEEGFENSENLTVPELGWRWHEQRKLLKDLSPLTHATDECELRKVERWFGGILVSDLSLSLLNMVYSSMREDHGVSRPRSAECTPLTLDEAIALCQALRSEGFDGRRVAVWLALATGVRRGEAIGLTWATTSTS